jgi:hypothetical protein
VFSDGVYNDNKKTKKIAHNFALVIEQAPRFRDNVATNSCNWIKLKSQGATVKPWLVSGISAVAIEFDPIHHDTDKTSWTWTFHDMNWSSIKSACFIDISSVEFLIKIGLTWTDHQLKVHALLISLVNHLNIILK